MCIGMDNTNKFRDYGALKKKTNAHTIMIHFSACSICFILGAKRRVPILLF